MRALSYLPIAIAAAVTVPAAQAQDKTLTAAVTIKTVGHTTAVHGKSGDAKQGDFLFCIDQTRSGAARAVDFAGEARVIYRPMPVLGIPESMIGKTPESVASVLTVISSTGRAWTFVGQGLTPLQPPANAITVPVSIVRKTDWSPGTGPRRGTDISSCLIAGG